MGEDYLKLAEYKGLSPRRIFLWYEVCNAVLPQLTALAISVAFIFSGAVNGVSFTLEKGERLGLVGESGSGKSTLALSLMAAHKEPARIANGRVLVNGTDILERSPPS